MKLNGVPKRLLLIVLGGCILLLIGYFLRGGEQKKLVVVSNSSIPPLSNAKMSMKDGAMLYTTRNGFWRYNIVTQNVSSVWSGIKLPTLSNVSWSYDESSIILSAYDYSPSDTLGSIIKDQGLDMNSRYWWIIDLKNKKPILLSKNTTSASFSRSQTGSVFSTEYLGANNQSDITIFQTDYQKGVKKKLFSKPDVVSVEATYGDDLILSFKDLEGLSIARVNGYGEVGRIYTSKALRGGEMSPDGRYIAFSEGSYLDDGFEEVKAGGKVKIYSIESDKEQFSAPIENVTPSYDWVASNDGHMLLLKLGVGSSNYEVKEVNLDSNSETLLSLDNKRSWGTVQITNFLKSANGPLLVSSASNITEIHSKDQNPILKNEKQPSKIDYTTNDYSISYTSYATGFIINTTAADSVNAVSSAIDYLSKTLGYKIPLYNISVVNRGDNYVGP